MLKGDLMQRLRNPMDRQLDMLVIIAHCGMISPEHISTLQAVAKTTVVQNAYFLNQKGDFIQKVHPPKNNRRKRPYRSGQKLGPRMYILGPDAKPVLEETLGEEITIKRYTSYLHEHTWGINHILTELVQAMGYDAAFERIGWFNTSQAIRDIHQMWDQCPEGIKFKGNAKERFEEKNKLIKPDARCRIDQTYLWLEYDNSTESQLDVKPKLHGYIYAMNLFGNRDPIVWVVPDQERKDELKQWWEEVQNFDQYQKWLAEGGDFFLPKMLFATLDEVYKLVSIFADPVPVAKNDSYDLSG
jgi:hypothetical protein